MLTRTLNFEQIFTAFNSWPNEHSILVGFDTEKSVPVYADEGDYTPGITIGNQYFEKLTAELSSGEDNYLTGHLADGHITVDLRFCKEYQTNPVPLSILVGPTTEDRETWHLVVDYTSVENCDHIDDDHEAIAKVPVVVIDLETLDTTGNSKIFEIGAVFGCLLADRIYSTHYYVVDPETQPGRQASIGTRMFHEEICKKNPIYGKIRSREFPYTLEEALMALTTWITRIRKRYPNVQVITNGPEFDAANLQTAYDQLRGAIPWSFRSNQSLRTLKWLSDSFCPINDELKEFSQINKALDHHGFYDAWKEFKYAGFQYRALRLPHTVNLSEGELEPIGVSPACRTESGDLIERFENFELTELDITELKRLGMPKLLTELLKPGIYIQCDAVAPLMLRYSNEKRILYRTGTLIQHPKGVWWKF